MSKLVKKIARQRLLAREKRKRAARLRTQDKHGDGKGRERAFLSRQRVPSAGAAP